MSSAWELIPESLQEALYEYGAYGTLHGTNTVDYLLHQLTNWVLENAMCMHDGCDLVATVGTEYCSYHVTKYLI